MKNVQARADKLLNLVIEKIETGEFTMWGGYLKDNPVLGPCGCALAAAAYALGTPTPDNTFGAGRGACEDGIVISGICTPNEARFLEAGYEGWDDPVEDGLISRASLDRNPFFKAGVALREFRD